MLDGKMADPRAILALERAAKRAAARSNCVVGLVVTAASPADNLPDDDPKIGFTLRQKAAFELKYRFLQRLASIVCSMPALGGVAVSLLKEDERLMTATIWVGSSAPQSGDVTGTLSRIGELLGRLSRAQNGEPLFNICHSLSNMPSVGPQDPAWAALWNIVFQCYHTRIQNCVGGMQQIFKKHHHVFEELMTDLLGVFQDHPESLDDEAGSELIKIWGFISSLTKFCDEDYNTIIKEGFNLMSIQQFQQRSSILLGSALAEDLYPKIRLLAQVRRSFNTLVRAARVLPTFSKIVTRLGFPPKESTPRSPPHPHPRSLPLRPRLSPPQPSLAPSESASPGTTATSAVQTVRLGPGPIPAAEVAGSNTGDLAPNTAKEVFKKGLLYLPPSERHIGLQKLEPIEKRETLLLVRSILENQTPNPSWNCYYLFGFPVCRDEDERQILVELYRVVLTTCSDKVSTFKNLWQALKQNTLPALFEKHGWSHCYRYIPDLKNFLATPVKKRPSVFRLIQFIQAEESTDPPPCLIRDYGFDICRMREEVTVLKNIYKEMLATQGPRQVHRTCVAGNFQEMVESLGIQVDKKHHRLLRNQFGDPGLGFEYVPPSSPFNKALFHGRK